MIHSESLRMVEVVAEGLGPLREKVVFIGGASTALLIDDPVAENIRPTDDVDCVFEVASRTEFSQLQAELRGLGFSHVTYPGASICRWRYKDISVDVMPNAKEFLGFTNMWYEEGIDNAQQIKLPGGLQIRIFILAYFVASKIEALKARSNDLRSSHDLEDIVIVLDGRLDLADLEQAPTSVVRYLAREFGGFLTNPNFEEAVYGHLPPDTVNLSRTQRIMSFLKYFSHKKF